jgi:hypothetical protein
MLEACSLPNLLRGNGVSTTYDLQAAQYSSALQHAELLQELESENQQFDQLLVTIRRLTR